MNFEISGPIWYWRGPAPFYFVTVPEEESKEMRALERLATYGWGMIPVEATLGDSTWVTSLWPKDGRYVLPLKTAIRRAEGVEEGSIVSVALSVLIAEDRR